MKQIKDKTRNTKNIKLISRQKGFRGKSNRLSLGKVCGEKIVPNGLNNKHIQINRNRKIWSKEKVNQTAGRSNNTANSSLKQSDKKKPVHIVRTYYQQEAYQSFKCKEKNQNIKYISDHFLQTIEAIRFAKDYSLPSQFQFLQIPQNSFGKTVFLDLDETLVHCSEDLENSTIKLNFCVEGDPNIKAVSIRPYCEYFLKEVSSFAQIIIFTASPSSYADIILDFFDPHKKFFSHRLYRQNCVICGGFYLKDLRISNRQLKDCVLIDNSAISFMCQPNNGIPIRSYFQDQNDIQLLRLLKYLKQVLNCQDVREKIEKTFFWENYLVNSDDPEKIFLESYALTKKKE